MRGLDHRSGANGIRQLAALFGTYGSFSISAPGEHQGATRPPAPLSTTRRTMLAVQRRVSSLS